MLVGRASCVRFDLVVRVHLMPCVWVYEPQPIDRSVSVLCIDGARDVNCTVRSVTWLHRTWHVPIATDVCRRMMRWSSSNSSAIYVWKDTVEYDVNEWTLASHCFSIRLWFFSRRCWFISCDVCGTCDHADIMLYSPRRPSIAWRWWCLAWLILPIGANSWVARWMRRLFDQTRLFWPEQLWEVVSS